MSILNATRSLPNRRDILLGGASALVLAGCQQEDIGDASASRGGDRFIFKDTVGWIELGGRMAVVAFIPFLLSAEQRANAIAGRGVFPAVEPYDPMVEMRFELTRPGGRIVKDDLKSVQLTFWHFAAPAPVVKAEASDFEGENGISFVGLDGEARQGGWTVGTVRGQRVVPTASGRDVSYTWNLKWQSNLG